MRCTPRLLISAPRGVYYFLSLTLSVPMSVRLSVTPLQIDSSFFVSRWNRAIFWPSVLHVVLYKMLFLDFWFRPPNAQNLLSKICTKSPISRLVWQIDRRCLGLLGGFRGWPMQWNHVHCTMLWGRPLLLWQQHLGKFGLFFDKIAHESSCMPDRADIVWAYQRRRPAGPSFAAKATTSETGAESNCLPAC